MKNNVKTFASGLKLVHFENVNCRSISILATFGVGCNVETKENNGISHFIEHMMFKGTKKRNAFEIVRDIEAVGASINAFTSKLLTCYYTKSIDEEAETCAEVLSDILTNSVFDEEEMEREKKVVLEEIAMSEDDNDDLCSEMLAELYFGDHPLAKTILGPKENILKFTRQDIIDYINNNYCANNMTISICGNISLEKAEEMVLKYFEGKFKRIENRKWLDEKHMTVPKYATKFKDIEQSNISIGMPCISYSDDLASIIALDLFGGGMSSRLFQEIREKLGLAYSVGCAPTPYFNNSINEIYIATNKESVEKAVKAIRKTIDDVLENGFTEEEVLKGKKSLMSKYSLVIESQIAYIRFISRQELMKERIEDFDKSIETIRNFSVQDINDAFRKCFDVSKASVSYVGKEIDVNLFDVFHAKS